MAGNVRQGADARAAWSLRQIFYTAAGLLGKVLAVDHREKARGHVMNYFRWFMAAAYLLPLVFRADRGSGNEALHHPERILAA